jgi:hypothetical protein
MSNDMSRDLFDCDGLKHDRIGTLLGEFAGDDRVPFWRRIGRAMTPTLDMPFDLDPALWFRLVIHLIMKG